MSAEGLGSATGEGRGSAAGVVGAGREVGLVLGAGLAGIVWPSCCAILVDAHASKIDASANTLISLARILVSFMVPYLSGARANCRTCLNTPALPNLPCYPCFCLFFMLILHESPPQQQHPSFDEFCFDSCFVWFDIEHESPLQQHDGIEQHDSVFFGWSAGLVVCAPTVEKTAANASMRPRASPRMFFIISS